MANFIEDIINEDLASGAVKSVVTRIPPEPNGYLHIGHAKSVYINYYMTAKAYGGKCYLRFDDTNPTREYIECVEANKEDIQCLGFQLRHEYYVIDYFQHLWDFAVNLIKEGKA